MKTLIRTWMMTPAAAVALAQMAPLPPLPPEPPFAPLPARAPLPPLPPVAPLGLTLDAPLAPLFLAQQSSTAERIREERERQREAAERAREAADRMRERGSSARESYRDGQEALDERKYERAVRYFDRAIEYKIDRPDGALYWKSYALYKMGRRDEALATLAEMQKTHPGSRWLNDAKALEVEVKNATGQGVSPDSLSDEDLKLLAINSLMNTDPERALPLLEKVLNEPKSGPRLKQRALFVLAQSGDAKAREVVARYAKGASNPDLQLRAIEYLGSFGRREGVPQILADVYRSSNDEGVKRAVLRSYMIARDAQKLFEAAKSEGNEELKIYAIQMLGATKATAELGQLYTADAPTEVKRAILNAYLSAGEPEKILDLIKNEKDPVLKQRAIRVLGSMRRTQSTDGLMAMYAAESDKDTRTEIIRSLYTQGAAKQLVDLARKESDATLKGEMVKRLANMKAKEATDFMMELLNK